MEESVREEWRDVKGYEGKYRVSNLGRVQSCTRKTRYQWRDLSAAKNNSGYIGVGLWKNGKSARLLVHRLVAEAFCGVAGGDTVDHINGIKDDNRACNLEWVTMSENHLRSFRNGRAGATRPGEDHHLAKATEEMIRIGLAVYAGGVHAREVSRRMGMYPSWLGKILNGFAWSHIDIDIGRYRQQHALSRQRASNLRKQGAQAAG